MKINLPICPPRADELIPPAEGLDSPPIRATKEKNANNRIITNIHPNTLLLKYVAEGQSLPDAA